MKQCSKCRMVKSPDEFHNDSTKKDGKVTICKHCVLERVKKYRQTKQGQDKVKKYNFSEARKKSYIKYNQSGKAKQASVKYYKSKKGKDTSKKYHQNRPEIAKAGNKVRNEIRYGRMPPASKLKCNHCANQAESYHHYKGYSKKHWLDVIPLCNKCHRAADGSWSEKYL